MTNDNAATNETPCPYCQQIHPVIDGVRKTGCSMAAFAPAGKPKTQAQLKAASIRRARRYGHTY